MVRDKAKAEDADQDQHVPARLNQLLGVGGRRLSLLCQQQPARGGGVEEDQGDEDHQKDDGRAGVDDFVEQADLLTVQDVTTRQSRDTILSLLGDEGQDHVGAGHGQKEPPGDCGDDVGGSGRLQDVVSYRIDDLQIPAERTDVGSVHSQVVLFGQTSNYYLNKESNPLQTQTHVAVNELFSC